MTNLNSWLNLIYQKNKVDALNNIAKKLLTHTPLNIVKKTRIL